MRTLTNTLVLCVEKSLFTRDLHQGSLDILQELAGNSSGGLQQLSRNVLEVHEGGFENSQVGLQGYACSHVL